LSWLDAPHVEHEVASVIFRDPAPITSGTMIAANSAITASNASETAR
jgi:hypothetical protein